MFVFDYHETENVGHAKYVVSFYSGKRHPDGSKFYDVAIFSNRKTKDRFVRLLQQRLVTVA